MYIYMCARKKKKGSWYVHESLFFLSTAATCTPCISLLFRQENWNLSRRYWVMEESHFSLSKVQENGRNAGRWLWEQGQCYGLSHH